MRVDAGRTVRVYRLDDGRPRTSAVAVDGRDVATGAGPEVTVTVDGRRLTDRDLVVGDVREAPGDAGLSWTLSDGDVRVRMVVEADRAVGVVRKRAEVTGRGRLQHVELDRWPGLAADGFAATGEPVAYNVGPVGLGQPVFGPGLFAGVEHPASENLVADGATLALPMAADLGPEACTTPAAVLGAGGLEAFWDYVDTLRPVPPRLVVLTNNWYHLGETGLMDEAAVRAEVAGFEAVTARHGLPFDFHCLDDGWDGDWADATGLWGKMAAGFPHGLGPLGPGIGLWLSPMGGYAARRQARLAWAGAHGLEVSSDGGVLCTAGARYRAHLADALTRWTEAGVGYWKLDGVRFDCTDEGHGHPVGPGARTAQVDGFLGLVGGIRAVRPDAAVAFTIGSHPSPWWLRSVDFLWRGGLDDTAAEQPGTRLDRFDTYIDCCLQAYRPAALPVSALVTFSIVESAAAGYRDDGDAAGWARHCWLAVGRGTLHHDLYVAPDSLSEGEWAVLAEALAWARRHAPVLARSRMVLGDPGAGEVYGFVARRGAAATVCLRNPSDARLSTDCDWEGLLGWPAELETVFGQPASATGRLTLDPFEVLVVEATRRR